MQEDYGDRLANMEWRQVYDIVGALHQDRKVTKGAGWGGWLDNEDSSACEELTSGQRRKAKVMMPRRGTGALELGGEVAVG